MFKKIISAVKNFFKKEVKNEKVEQENSSKYDELVRTSRIVSALVHMESKANEQKELQNATRTNLKRVRHTPKAWTWEEWKNYNREQVKLLDKMQQSKMA